MTRSCRGVRRNASIVFAWVPSWSTVPFVTYCIPTADGRIAVLRTHGTVPLTNYRYATRAEALDFIDRWYREETMVRRSEFHVTVISCSLGSRVCVPKYASIKEAEERAAVETAGAWMSVAYVRNDYGTNLAVYRQGRKVTP